MSDPTPPSGKDELRERHCIHWFVNKGTRGAPGTAWQECEMCGMKLKDFLALSNQQAVQKARQEAFDLAKSCTRRHLHGRLHCICFEELRRGLYNVTLAAAQPDKNDGREQ